LRIARRLLPVNYAGQGTGLLFAGLAELGLWRGDLERARELVAEAVPLGAANLRHAAPLYALSVRIEADGAELARAPARRNRHRRQCCGRTARSSLAGRVWPSRRRPTGVSARALGRLAREPGLLRGQRPGSLGPISYPVL
jgi:hypothetical protein